MGNKFVSSLLGFSFLFFLPSPAFSQQSCVNLFSPPPALSQEYQLKVEAGARFTAFFEIVNENIKEREYLIEVAQLALISEEHMLLLGPPGNAKSMFADEVLGNIQNQNATYTTYFKIQMTPETTLSETHGPLDYKKLTQDNVYQRLLDEGMLMSEYVFIDEIFDARANSLRNILMAANERSHAQGKQNVKGKIKTIFAASNRYISEVYEKAGDDGPKAAIDRFAFVVFVPGDLENTQTAIDLIRNAKKAKKDYPALTVDDIQSLSSLVKEVEIPVHVAKILSLLRSRVKLETENIEQSALKTYRDKIRNGEEAKPPYRSTKYHSPRTLAKAGGILKTIVVLDWIKSGGRRSLTATVEDLKKLENFLTLNGPSKEFIEQELSKSTNPHEQAQLMTIIQEREILRNNFDELLNDLNETLYKFSLTDLQNEIAEAKTVEQKHELGKKIVDVLIDIDALVIDSTKLSDLSAEKIGLEFVHNFITTSLKELYGADYNVRVSELMKEVEHERLEKAQSEAHQEELKRLEQERLAAEKKTAMQNEAAASLATNKDLNAFVQKLRDASSLEFTQIIPVQLTDHRTHFLKDENSGVVFFLDRDATVYRVLKDGTVEKSENNSSALLGSIFSAAIDDRKIAYAIDGKRFYVMDAKTGLDIMDFTMHTSRTLRALTHVPGTHRGLAIDISQDQLVSINLTTGDLDMLPLKVSAALQNKTDLNSILRGMQAISGQDVVLESADGLNYYFTSHGLNKFYRVEKATGEIHEVLVSPTNMLSEHSFLSFDSKTHTLYYSSRLGTSNINGIKIAAIPLDAPDKRVELSSTTIGLVLRDAKVLEDGKHVLINDTSTVGEVGLLLLDLERGSVLASNLLFNPVGVKKFIQVGSDFMLILHRDGIYLKRITPRKPITPDDQDFGL